MKTKQEIDTICNRTGVHAFEYSVMKDNENKSRSRMVVLIGGFGEPNPRAFMDGVVAECVADGEPFNEYIEGTMDNPWIRILFSDMNNLIN